MSTCLITSISELIEYIASGKIDYLRQTVANNNNFNTIGLDYNLPFSLEFIVQNKDEILIDTCFFLLNVSCKTFVSSKKLDIIKELFGKYYREFIPINHLNTQNQRLFKLCSEEIIQDKIAFFLGLYSENIFLKLHLKNNIASVILTPGYEEVLMYSIQFLFKLMLNYSNNQGTSFQACFSLKSLLSIDVLKPYYNKIFEGFFDNLINGVKEIELYPYFDLIIDILSVPPCKLKSTFVLDSNDNNVLNKEVLEISLRKMPFTHDQMLELIKSCVERCLKELKSTTKGSSNGLSKCFNILFTISELYVENTSLPMTEEHKKQLEEMALLPGTSYDKFLNVNNFEYLLSPITMYLKQPKKIECEVEIVDIVTNLQKNTQNLLESTILIMKSIKKIIEKNETINKSIYDIIYQIFDKGTEYLKNFNSTQVLTNSTEETSIVPNESENIIENLIDIVKTNLDDYDSENTYILSVLILQKIVQVSF